MFPTRLVLKFAAWLWVVGALLLAPWPGVERGYAALFRFGGNIVFAKFLFWPDASVKFRDPAHIPPGDLPFGIEAPPALGEMDTVMILENRTARGDLSFLRTSSRFIGFMPTAIMIGLVLATPVRWKRRLIALGLGLLAAHAFIILRVSLKLAVDGFSGNKGVAIFHPSPFWAKFWSGASTVLHEDPTVSLVVPVLIWFVLLFRPSQWSAIGQANGHASFQHGTDSA